MATATEQQEQIQLLGISPQKDAIDLSALVKDATWKEMLVELVRNNQFDPWNIDITQIVDKYVEAVRTFKVMDLRVPANIILAAAVLLRLKSEVLTFTEPEPPLMDDGQPFVRPDVQIEGLTLRLRPPLKRKIALTELIEAMEEAMSIKERRATRFTALPQIPITIQKVDIEEELKNLHETISRHVDKKNMTTFSYLLKEGGFSDVLVQLFAPMLYLASRGQISLIQENFFGEIIIALNS